MYNSIKSVTILILFSIFFTSCAITQEDVTSTKMSGIEKEKKEKKSSGEILRNQLNRIRRFDR